MEYAKLVIQMSYITSRWGFRSKETTALQKQIYNLMYLGKLIQACKDLVNMIHQLTWQTDEHLCRSNLFQRALFATT